MGSIWLQDLPTVIRNAGLSVSTYAGWETRCRSSGGYDQVWAVFVHHTASNTSVANDTAYMWQGSPDRPVGAMLLDRTGHITVGAAGATNCQGKGGPYPVSRGTIPLDKGNQYGIAIEAANNGVGETWPHDQQEAYLILVNALCNAYGLSIQRDVIAHREWAPTRKIDPAGNSRWATGSNSWDMNSFRNDCESVGDEIVTDADIDKIAQRVWSYIIHYAKQQPDGGEKDAAEPASSVLSAAASYAGRAN